MENPNKARFIVICAPVLTHAPRFFYLLSFLSLSAVRAFGDNLRLKLILAKYYVFLVNSMLRARDYYLWKLEI